MKPATWIRQLTAFFRWLHRENAEECAHDRFHRLGESATRPIEPRCDALGHDLHFPRSRGTFGNGQVACPEGLEPPTPSLEGWCSIQLSYGQPDRAASLRGVARRHRAARCSSMT